MIKLSYMGSEQYPNHHDKYNSNQAEVDEQINQLIRELKQTYVLLSEEDALFWKKLRKMRQEKGDISNEEIQLWIDRFGDRQNDQ